MAPQTPYTHGGDKRPDECSTRSWRRIFIRVFVAARNVRIRARPCDRGQCQRHAVATSFALDDFSLLGDGVSLQVKAVTSLGDPGDLGSDEERRIIDALPRMVKEVDGE